jgi:predicted HTH domain antitoxin
MARVELELDPSVFSVLRKSPEELAEELKRAAVVQWYAEGRISQAKAAEVLGVSRAELLGELHRRRVPACQVTLEEVMEEGRVGE